MAHVIKNIESDNEIDSLLNKHYITEVRSGFVEVDDDKVCVPVYYRNYEKRIDEFEVRDSDVYLIAHPKTGTTWAQEMIWLIVNNLNYEAAKEDILKRFPTMESAAHIDSEVVDVGAFFGIDFMTYLDEMPSPRCIKSHLHWSMLPRQIQNDTKKPKIISILRNAEDTCVSFYHHCKLVEGYTGTFDEFCQLFLAGRSCYGPFWKSVLSIWRQRHRSNVLFIKYTDMKKDLKEVIRKVAKFLEREVHEDAIVEMEKHLSFDSMKKNSAVNFQFVVDTFAAMYNMTTAENVFIRRGVAGGYKSEMTDEQICSFKKWTQENIEGTGLEVE
ncbi:hypothetical protein FQA39_LY16236 [Lamprigera yunnana]|nr:hypothetical protein FQA39_LY16236 [Lamprigera yunnana]